MNLKGNLINKDQLKNINIQELLKYGKSVYYEKKAMEFPDSYGPGYVMKENSTAYLVNNVLMLKHMHQSITGLSPDLDSRAIDEYFKEYSNCSYLIIDGNKKEYLEVAQPNLQNLSTYEKVLYGKAESLVQEAEEKNKNVKKLDKQYIRNFFRNLFGNKKSQTLIHETSNMTAQEIKTILDNIQSHFEEASSYYESKKSKSKNFVKNLSYKSKKSDLYNQSEEISSNMSISSVQLPTDEEPRK